tara:strand:+ start:1882 stop:2142 length:261 start_codon:yes stop_codon:yes gene_type:complete
LISTFIFFLFSFSAPLATLQRLAMTMRRPSLKDLQQLRQKLEGPPTLLCYICGREFGISSLQIHQKACLHKVKEINKRRPKVRRVV